MNDLNFSFAPFAEVVAKRVAELLAEELKELAKKPEPRYYTRQDLCEKLHISLPTVHSMIHKGMLHPIKVSGKTLFNADEVDNDIQSGAIQRYKHG